MLKLLQTTNTHHHQLLMMQFVSLVENPVFVCFSLIAAIHADGAIDDRHIISHDELQMGKVLGEGSFGVVRRAVWRDIDVAVKEVFICCCCCCCCY
jgi:hypothetical protein